MKGTGVHWNPGRGLVVLLALAMASGCAPADPAPATGTAVSPPPSAASDAGAGKPSPTPGSPTASPLASVAPAPVGEPASESDAVATRTWLGPMPDAAFPGATAQPIEVRDVAWTGTAWVAVGWDTRGAIAWRSDDAVMWTHTGRQPSLDLGRMLTVATAGGRLVAGGMDASGSAAAWYSDDGGATWARAADNAAMRIYGAAGGPAHGYYSVAMQAIAAIPGGGFVAVGSLGCDCQVGGFAAWRSADGSAWERLGDPGHPEQGDGLAVEPAGNGWVAGGGALRTPHGDGWRTTPGTATALAVGHGLLIRATMSELTEQGATPQAFAWSADGTTWTTVPVEPSDARISGIAATPSGFVAVGVSATEDAAVAWTSADGRAWTRLAVPLLAGLPNAVASNPAGRVVIVTTVHDPDGDARPAAVVMPTAGGTVVPGTAPVRAAWVQPPLASTAPLALGGRVANAAAVVQPGGRILVIGGRREGSTDQHGSVLVLLVDPTTGAITQAPALPAAVANAAAVTTPDGRTWVVGSSWADEAPGNGFILDAAATTWTPVPAPLRDLAVVSLAAMPDGRVLVVDGANADGALLTFDPATGAVVHEDLPFAGPATAIAVSADRIYLVTSVRAWWRPLPGGAWTPGPLLPYHSATGQPELAAVILADGRLAVLTADVLGPTCATAGVASVLQVLDPDAGVWTSAALPQPRIGTTVVALPDGRLAVIGGYRRTLEDCGWSAEVDATGDGLLVMPPG